MLLLATPLKVWSKGEKLEHDSFWQIITAERYSKRLNEAYNADIVTGNMKGFLMYVFEPESQGYEANEWTKFVTRMSKIPKILHCNYEYKRSCRE